MPEPEPSQDPIEILATDDFSLGLCQVIPYNPPKPEYAPRFPDNYLSFLYSRMKESKILQPTFCGMQNLSHDAICSYMAGKPVFAAIEWDGPNRATYRTLGFGFIVSWIGINPPTPGPRSAFAAYAFFPDAWGTPEAEILGMLGLARMFHTYSLRRIYGQRYRENALTARFMRRYGFQDFAVLPEFMLYRNGTGVDLVDCVASDCTRWNFSRYVASQIASLA